MRRSILAAVVSVLGFASFASAGRVDAPSASLPTIANPVIVQPSLAQNATEALPYSAGGFETFAAGALSGQNSWTVDGSPATNYVVTPGIGVGGSQGVRVAGGATGTDWGYPTTTAYTPAASDLISINVDVSRSMGAAASSSSFGYFVDVYNAAVARTFRFGLGVNSGNQPVVVVTSKWSSTLGFSTAAPVASVIVSAALTPGTFYNLEARANYATDTFDLYNNNVLIQGGMPFTAVASDFSDADLQVSTGATATDAGIFDNYAINVLPVPEPTSLAALAGLSLVARRRR